MSDFSSMLSMLSHTSDITHKTQVAAYVLNAIKATRLTAEEVGAMTEVILGEMEMLMAQIPRAATYRKKSLLFDYEDALMGILVTLYPDPNALAVDKLERVRALAETVDRERYLERAVDELFASEEIEARDVDILLHIASTVRDEYQRGQLYFGLIHYKDRLRKLPEESHARITDYIASELERYLSEPSALDEDRIGSLEVACDACRYFLDERILRQLYEVLKLSRNHISYYAVETLLSAKQTVPREVVEALARDLEYADMTYALLERYRQTALFPAELADPEYLAKSDLVHWLMYPTELGKQPDRIEYLGRVKVKREPYYIFRYCSDSDNLGEDLKNKWLIGWSSKDGGTFSQFDEYAKYEKATPEKTVKYIKKMLL